MAKIENLDYLPLPTVDSSQRFPVDQALRKAGFRIVSRPQSGTPIWTNSGGTFPQPIAVRLLPAGDIADAQYLESLNAEGYE